jgi:hypothetical protein
MDKTPFENEDTSPIEPDLGTEHSIVIKEKMINVFSLPQKKQLSGSPKDENNPLPEEKPIDEEWLLLSRDWQTQPYAKTDIRKLVKQTKNRTLKAKLLFAINVFFTLAIVGTFFIAMYQGDWDMPTLIYLGFGSIGSIIFVYYELKIRLSVWSHLCDSPDKAIANAIAGVESSINYLKLTKLSFYILLPVVNYYLYVMSKTSGTPLWISLSMINFIMLISWLITHWFHNKRLQERSKLHS